MKLKDTIHDHLISNIFLFGFISFIFLYAGNFIGSDLTEIIKNSGQSQIFLSQLLEPEWSYLSQLIRPMFVTLAMSVAGTFIGTLFAIPAAFLGTYIVTRNTFITLIFRAIFSLIRTIPNLLLAAILVAISGIGEFTGVMTISIFTFGMLSQLVFNSIENVEYGPIEANESIGATKFQLAITSIWPQIETSVFQNILYTFEVNVRGSAVLGYVGAGGIGVLLNTALGFRQYGRVSLIILFILLIVVIVDLVSGYIRKEVL